MNRQEIKYIIYSALFAFIWFVLALPILTSMFDGNQPLIQFIIFTLGLYVFFFIFLKAVTSSATTDITSSFGLLSLFLALDILMPEYHVAFSGKLIEGATLGASTSDYAMGVVAQSLGLEGVLIYLFVYIIMPVILLLIAAKILPNFVRRI
jgi:hypothetical protein